VADVERLAAAPSTSIARTLASATSGAYAHCIGVSPPSGSAIGPAVEHAVPEELLAVERLPRPVNERRAEGGHREAGGGAHPEQRALARCLVRNVRVRMVVGRERVALAVPDAVAVGRHARHEHVALQLLAARLRGRLDLRWRRPFSQS
jgi:hypothetical protein